MSEEWMVGPGELLRNLSISQTSLERGCGEGKGIGFWLLQDGPWTEIGI